MKLPNLYSFVRDQRISVKNVLQVEDLDSLFMLPLCAQAFAEFQDLEAELQALPLAVGQHDVWSFIWGNSVYSSSKFYALVFKNMDVEPSFSWLWKSKCTPRIKFFGWLLLVDRLNTRNMVRRRHFHLDSGNACAMCNTSAEEDIFHLFFNCTFATSCWQKLRLRWPNTYDLHEKIAFGRRNSLHGFFMEIFLVASWELWNLRNDKIFNGAPVSTGIWVCKFKKQVKLQLLRVKESFHPQIVQWLDSIV